MATTVNGGALIAQGRHEEGIAGMRRGISAWRARGTSPAWSYCFLASAYPEALTQLNRALELLKHLPDDAERARTELAVQSRLLPAIGAAKGWATPELEPLYARARKLCAQIRDPALVFPVLFEQWITRWWKLELREGMELADELLAIAEQVKEAKMLLSAHWACGTILLERGELVSANEHLQKAVAVYDLGQRLADLQTELRRVAALSRLYLALHQLGYPDRAWVKSCEMLEVARRSSGAGILTAAYSSVAQYDLFRGDGAAAQKHAEEALALIETFGLHSFSPRTIAVKGGALIAQGCYEDGIAEMRRGISVYRAGWTTPPGWALSFLAEGLGRVGQHAEGLQALEDGFASVATTGEHVSIPSLHHVKGDLLLARNQSNAAEAEQCFRSAIEIARQQSARMAELRATTSLARLLAKQGRRDEARAMVSEIYGWFTEGFDTADLKEAKVLLDELSVNSGEC